MELKNVLTLGFVAAMLSAAGCNNSAEHAEQKADAGATAEAGHEHGEWWCSEHGVPEEICVQCDVTLAPDHKSKGDWCAEHDRPDSQCFICHPEKQAEFAAQYEAKYGEQPPKPTAEGEGDEHGHDHEHEEQKSES
jgi:hypothetical protein